MTDFVFLHGGSTPRIEVGNQVMNTRPQALSEVLLAQLVA